MQSPKIVGIEKERQNDNDVNLLMPEWCKANSKPVPFLLLR